jgi:L-amino acid N-acyltransferase
MGVFMTPEFTVRRARDSDLEALRVIYNHAVAHTTASYDYEPRSAQKQLEWFAAKNTGGYPVVVADLKGQPVGFASYGPFRAWMGYRFTVEHSVYVHESARRMGIASALVLAVQEAARAQDMHTMVAGIDATNSGSIEMHYKLGFESAGVLREVGYKFDRWLDLAFMVYKI